MDSTYTICYISKAAQELTTQDIKELFKNTSSVNNSNKVSGFLLHSINNFFQVLEGEERHLKNLFEKIQEDTRHSDIYEVYNKHTTHPVFKGYKSEFDIVKSSEDLEILVSYLSQNNANSTNLKLKRLLKPFAMLGDF
ncbi:BLUF domain-containing protein [uncultured Nonlabens sp.]|uniref:BLUF domain-containing protein n=1 Tax=uncultured Nonlabens sp. TaxID=859306 RepID=UPI0026190D35|nr:BLUF domain-containing protein [uncultured Nonlabens sp.]